MTDAGAHEPGTPERFRWYRGYIVALLAILAAGISIWSVPLFFANLPGPLSFYLLLALAIIADTPPFTAVRPASGSPGREEPTVVSASVCFTFAISIQWTGGATVSQLAAVAVAAAAFRRPLWRTLFDLGRYGLAVFVVGRVLSIEERPITLFSDLHDQVLVLAAALAWFAVFHLLTAVEEWLRTERGWWRVLRHRVGEEALTAAALLVLGVMVVSLVLLDGWIVLITLIPLYVVSRMVRLAYERTAQARRDPLTGLANRAGLAIEVERQVRMQAAPVRDLAPGPRFAIMMISVDSIRHINEAIGYQIGDRVVIAMAARLRGAIGTADTAARVGTDEFAVLIARATGVADVRRQAAGIAAALSGPIQVNQVPLHVTCSTGVAVYPDHGEDFATLLRRAKAAVQEAQERVVPVMLYRVGSRPEGTQRLSLLADLRDAVSGPSPTGVGLHYQPQIALDTGETVGVEALLRWRAPHHGPVDPDLVIQVAERSDLMWPLTQRVIEHALSNLAAWGAEGLYLRASANISVRDLYQPELPDWIAGRLDDSGVPPQQLQLEVTETALMTEIDQALAALHRLRDLNIAVSLDDFGTGYSSLARLRRLPVTEIKIDRSFITALPRDPAGQAVVHAIIDLGSRLGIRVVAEGVEDEETRDLLLASGCRVAQGWYYAAAMPPDDLSAWVSARTSARRNTGRGRRSTG